MQDLVSSDEEACCRAGGRNYCVVEDMKNYGFSRSQQSLLGKPNGIYTNGCFTVLKEEVARYPGTPVTCGGIRSTLKGHDNRLQHHLPPDECQAVYDAETDANAGACVWPGPVSNVRGWDAWNHAITDQRVIVGATKCAKYNGHAPCNLGTVDQRPVPRCRNIHPCAPCFAVLAVCTRSAHAPSSTLPCVCWRRAGKHRADRTRNHPRIRPATVPPGTPTRATTRPRLSARVVTSRWPGPPYRPTSASATATSAAARAAATPAR